MACEKSVEELKQEAIQAKARLRDAEQRLQPRLGVKMRIMDLEYARGGLFRITRPAYRIQCDNCGFVFKCPAKRDRAKCPRCHYGAEMHILEREWSPV